MLTKTDELENFAILEIYEKATLMNALVQECKKQQVFLDQITIPGKELAAFAKIAPVERFSVLVDIKKLIARSKKNAEVEKTIRLHMLRELGIDFVKTAEDLILDDKTSGREADLISVCLARKWQYTIWSFLQNVTTEERKITEQAIRKEIKAMIRRVAKDKKNGEKQFLKLKDSLPALAANFPIIFASIAETESTNFFRKNKKSYKLQISEKFQNMNDETEKLLDMFSSFVYHAFPLELPNQVKIYFQCGNSLSQYEELNDYWRENDTCFFVNPKDPKCDPEDNKRQEDMIQYVSGSLENGKFDDMVKNLKQINGEGIAMQERVNALILLANELCFHGAMLQAQGIDFVFMFRHTKFSKQEAKQIVQNSFYRFKVINGRYPAEEDTKEILMIIAEYITQTLVTDFATFFPVQSYSKNIQEKQNKNDNRFKKTIAKLEKENDTLKKITRNAKKDTEKSVSDAVKSAKAEIKELKSENAELRAESKEEIKKLNNSLAREQEKTERLQAEIERMKFTAELNSQKHDAKKEAEDWLENHQIIVYGSRMEVPGKIMESTRNAENIIFAEPNKELKTGWLQNCDGVIFKVDFTGHAAFNNAKIRVISANIPFVYSENGSTNVERFYEDILFLKNVIEKRKVC